MHKIADRHAIPETRHVRPNTERENGVTIFSNSDFDGHEAVHAFFDAATGLKGYIAVHSSALGPGFGGCRMWPYETEAQALSDVLRLSRGMSYKNALAGLAYGGGKAVIIGNSKSDKTQALFEAYGRAVDALGGRYITAEDVGIKVADMKAAARQTAYVSGIGRQGSDVGGDPSPNTAYGVFLGLKAAVRHKLGRDDLTGLRVAVQGVGNVGYHLCKHLHGAGAVLTVADVYKPNVERAHDAFGAGVVDPAAILFEEVDVLAPCALGGVINQETISDLQANVIAGAANNQLGTEEDGVTLRRRGILYAPDYVVNSAGIITVAAEYDGDVGQDEVSAKIERIHDRTLAIFERSDREDRPTSEVADQMAREIIAAA
jgi:leucine dehydrogenase